MHQLVKMKHYQKVWLDSYPVAKYLGELRGGREGLDRKKKTALGTYAEEYHDAKRPWYGDGSWALFLLSVILRIISMFTKRAFLESVMEGKPASIAFHTIGESAAVSAIVLTMKAQQRLTFNRNLWLQLATIVALLGDIGSAAFSGGSTHGPKVDVPQIISVSFKVVVDGTKSVGPCVALCKQAGRYTRSGMKLSGFWSLLRDGPGRDFAFEALPDKEQAWATNALLERLGGGLRPSELVVEPEPPAELCSFRLWVRSHFRQASFRLARFHRALSRRARFRRALFRQALFRRARSSGTNPPILPVYQPHR